MADEYDPSLPNQHAQLLFDSWKSGDLPDLYDWLSRKNIDANVETHEYITNKYEAEHAEVSN